MPRPLHFRVSKVIRKTIPTIQRNRLRPQKRQLRTPLNDVGQLSNRVESARLYAARAAHCDGNLCRHRSNGAGWLCAAVTAERTTRSQYETYACSADDHDEVCTGFCGTRAPVRARCFGFKL